MSVAKFCDECNGLLGELNLGNGKHYCSACGTEFDLPSNDKTFMKFYAGKKIKNISAEDSFRLSFVPTTNRIKKTCPGCNFGIMSCVHDAEYKFSFTCIKCRKTYS